MVCNYLSAAWETLALMWLDGGDDLLSLHEIVEDA